MQRYVLQRYVVQRYVLQRYVVQRYVVQTCTRAENPWFQQKVNEIESGKFKVFQEEECGKA